MIFADRYHIGPTTPCLGVRLSNMLELQRNFLLEVFGLYVTEVHAPLLKAKNRDIQENTSRPELIVQEGLNYTPGRKDIRPSQN